MNQPTPEKPEPHATVGAVVAFIGAAMAMEGAIIALCSIPLVMFGGFGLIGIVAGGALVWTGLVLAGHLRGDARLASIVTLLAGGAATFAAFGSTLLLSCRSIVNCGPSEGVFWLVLPFAVAALNLTGFAILSRRAADGR